MNEWCIICALFRELGGLTCSVYLWEVLARLEYSVLGHSVSNTLYYFPTL